MFHTEVVSCPYPPRLDWTGKACQGQTLQLNLNIHKLWKKKLYKIGPRAIKLFMAVRNSGTN
jgi:hypothetical protein